MHEVDDHCILYPVITERELLSGAPDDNLRVSLLCSQQKHCRCSRQELLRVSGNAIVSVTVHSFPVIGLFTPLICYIQQTS